MAEADRRRWDERYATMAAPAARQIAAPAVWRRHAQRFPTSGSALELACGQGAASVWLALRGLTVVGVDISAVAIGQARDLARRAGVGGRCRFEVTDLDGGLPAGPPADVVVCHMFWDRRLGRAIVERLAPGGLLAITVLSEVGAAPGPYRAARGELADVYGDLEVLAAGEADGRAWLLARGRGPSA